MVTRFRCCNVRGTLSLSVVARFTQSLLCSDQQKMSDRESMARQTHKHTHTCSPLRRCFFLVLRWMLLIPGTGFRSLLLTAGGFRMGLGARVKHTGSPAAHMRIPVIPDTNTQIDASAVDHGTIRPRSWVWFPGYAWTDKLYTLNAMQVALDKKHLSIALMEIA